MSTRLTDDQHVLVNPGVTRMARIGERHPETFDRELAAFKDVESCSGRMVLLYGKASPSASTLIDPGVTWVARVGEGHPETFDGELAAFKKIASYSGRVELLHGEASHSASTSRAMSTRPAALEYGTGPALEVLTRAYIEVSRRDTIVVGLVPY
jgi:hypothetical protein